MDSLRLKNEILIQMPPKFRGLLSKTDFSDVQEIRFRAEKPLMVYTKSGAVFVTTDGEKTMCSEQAAVTSKTDLYELLSMFCENSVYAYQHEICDGFLTLCGGHRVGISGRCVLKNGEVNNIADVSGLNLRVAREYIGCARQVFSAIKRADGSLSNTILIGPPQGGKTTYLRDLARLISDCHKVTIVDERSEIAAIKDGITQFSVGLQTDVLDRFPKAKGMICAIRSLSPEVLITDELGGKEDLEAVKSVLNAGCRIITSMHGDSPEEFCGEKKALFNLFDQAVLLKRVLGVPHVEQILEIKKQ